MTLQQILYFITVILYESHEHLSPFRHHGHHKSIARLITAVSVRKKNHWGDADKILDQIRLQEVPHVHL